MMSRKRRQKIDYLRRLAAGQLTPEELAQLLPQKTRVWFFKEGLYWGPAGERLTEEQMREYKFDYPGPVVNVIMRRAKERPTSVEPI